MANPLRSLKRAGLRAATPWRLYSAFVLLAAVAGAVETSAPLFRHVDQAERAMAMAPSAQLRLLADQDFPPFSYVTNSGTAAGLSVDLALFACSEAKITCTIAMKPFHQLLPSLLRNDGDVIISGMRIDQQLMSHATMTRPYFWSFGRFAARRGTALKDSGPAALAGKRVGYVEGTAHGAWLEAHYGQATLVPYKSEKELQTALRAEKLDAIFGDNLRITFWLTGNAADGCCIGLGEPYADRAFFTRNLAFILRRENESERQALDSALDRLQEKKISADVFKRYLPPGFW